MRSNLLVWMLIAGLIGLRPVQCSAEWPGFLGPGGNPVAVQSSLPTEFVVDEDEPKNIAWRRPIEGRSVSGPIVINNMVITTSSSAREGRWMHVTAVSADSGEVIWHRSTESTGRPYCHPTSANAAPTPCTDGKRVFAFFSSNDLVCYDLDGNLQWFRSLSDKHPLIGNDVGMSSSPLVVGDVVVVTVECQGDSFTAGLSTETGETLWELPRPRKANWSSPRVAEGSDGKSVVVIHGAQNLIGIDPLSGSQVWEIDTSFSSVASAVFAQGRLFVPVRGALQVYEFGAAFDEPKKVADTTGVRPGSSSLLVTPYGVVGLSGSILACCDPSGEEIWKARVKDAGQIWATPVLAGNALYTFAMNGKCFVFKLGDEKAELMSECELGEDVLGSPAISNNALFVRSVDALWKIAATD